MNNQEAKKVIVQYARRLDVAGMVTLFEGNISMRTDEGFVITPSAFDKAYITPEDVIEMDADGNVMNPQCGRKISTEYRLHLTAFKLRSDMDACIHFHSAYATAFAVAGRSIETRGDTTAVVLFGDIPLCRYGRQRTPQIAADLEKYLPDHTGVLLENHGAMVVGPDMGRAYANALILEKTAKIAYIAGHMGGEKLLPQSEIDFLRTL